MDKIHKHSVKDLPDRPISKKSCTIKRWYYGDVIFFDPYLVSSTTLQLTAPERPIYRIDLNGFCAALLHNMLGQIDFENSTN